MNQDVYLNLLDIAEDELDWPFMSAATGFENSTWNGHPIGQVDSGALRTFQMNRCTFRDYQNIAVNGARSSAMLNSIINSLARNKTDHPVFLTYALIGNGFFSFFSFFFCEIILQFKKTFVMDMLE